MHFPRMTTRRWMIAVAVVAVGVGVLKERRERFRVIARHHVDQGGLPYEPEVWSGSMQMWYHTELAIKYESAARYPWLPVPPDPPEPK